MKKIIKLTLCAAAFFGLAACSNDESEKSPLPGEQGEKTQVKITLTTNTPRSYAAPVGAAEPTIEERTIKNARLYIFNSQRNLVENVAFDIDSGQATKVLELTTGYFYFYALVNIPDSNTNSFVTGSTTIDSFEKHLYTSLALNDVTSSTDGFWMTNLSTPTPQNIVVATQAQAEAGTHNAITIPVGRFVSKVALDYIPTEETGGTLTGVQYSVMNMATSSYLIPTYLNGVLYTPKYNDAAVNTSYYTAHPEGYQTAGTVSQPCDDFLYIFENSNAVPKQGNSTYISLTGYFIPSTWMNADGTTNSTPATQGEDFWRIANVDSDGYIVDYTDGYYSDVPNAGLYDSSYQKAVKYTSGQTYYGWWISDPNVTGNTSKKYSVDRNLFYWVTINSISGAGHGDDKDVDEDKEKELDSEAWLKATVQVMDWTLEERSVDL